MTTSPTTDIHGAVTWFEVGSTDPEAARLFYSQAFGWRFDEMGPYSIITTGDGHTLQGGIQDTRETPEGTPSNYAVPYVQVDDVARACKKVEQLGGKVIVPATDTPMGLVYAHVADTEGNHIGLYCPPAG